MPKFKHHVRDGVITHGPSGQKFVVKNGVVDVPDHAIAADLGLTAAIGPSDAPAVGASDQDKKTRQNDKGGASDKDEK